MGYSTTIEVDAILGQALTSARPDATVNQHIKLINIGEVRDLNRISTEIVEFYISLADSQIDGVLSQQYFTPFSKCQDGQWNLEEDINAPAATPHDQTSSSGTDGASSPTVPSNQVTITDTRNLIAGDEILIIDDITGQKERAIVASIVDQNIFTTVDDIEGSFFIVDEVRVTRIKFPPPLNQISARLAASFIYDKYFASQSSPNVSDYGKEMRTIAMGQINDILNGKAIMRCARRRGDIFGNPWIDDTYQHRDRGYNTGDRNMSKL